jgi:DNA-binding MarR family transcriptional regulator
MPNKAQSKDIVYKIHKAVFLLDKLSDKILQTSLGLSFSQFLVMMVLANQPKVPQKFVAAALDQTQAAVSRQIDLLVDASIVLREKNKLSKREYVLSLTKSGINKYNQSWDVLNKQLMDIFQIWPKQDQNKIVALLDDLITKMHLTDSKSKRESQHIS